MQDRQRTGRLATASMAAIAAALSAISGAALLAQPTVAFAQDYTAGDLTGRVETDAGQPVTEATITVRSAQGQTRTARSGRDGAYRIPALAAGAYTADVSAPGLAPVARQTVVVTPGGSSFIFTLPRVAAASELVVTARARRGEDFNRTDTGLTIEAPQLASRLPVAREVGALALLAPGVSLADASLVSVGDRRPGQALVSVAGGSAAEQAYYLNGLNVTDQRNFLSFAAVPFEALETVDVKTGGYSAEFGRATGGVINMVTRSGSNEFHAGASVYATPDILRSDAKDTYNAQGLLGARTLNSARTASSVDANVWLSGPIWRDRLFFFGIINPHSDRGEGPLVTNGVTGASAESGYQQKTRADTPRWLTKIDLNITDRQRIEATLFSDAEKLYATTYQWSAAGGLTNPTTLVGKSGGFNQIYRYTGSFTDWFTLSALFGRLNSQYTDEGSFFGTPLVQDLSFLPSPANPTGAPRYLTPVTQLSPVDINGEDRRDTYRIDADFYFRAFGDHHVRVGYDDEELRSTDQKVYTGGFAEYLLNTLTQPLQTPPVAGQPAYDGDYAAVFSYRSGGVFKASQAAYYLQDSWRVTPGLTLQLGVRNDLYDYKTASGLSFIRTHDQWAPRVGVTWDPSHRGLDKVYASFGRYYLPIAQNVAILEAASAPYSVSFYRLNRNAGGDVVLNPDGTAVLGPKIAQTAVFHGEQAPSPGIIASANLEPMYKDEFILGYEHTFRGGAFGGWLDGARVGVAYRERWLGQAIEDTLLENNGVGAFYRYCARTGTSCANVPVAYAGQYTLFNPGRPAIVMADLAGTGAPQRIELTNADLGDMPEAENRYRALEFTFERPFDGKWALGGSYVLASSRGNYEGPVKSDTTQTDASITQDFDQSFYAWGASGDLPNDHRHTIKLRASYSPIDNLVLGVNVMAQSGRRFGCLGYIGDAAIEPVPSATPVEWYCPLGTQIGATSAGMPAYATVPTPRGSQFETPWTTQVDVKIAYDLPRFGAFGRARVEMDVFNLFNSQTELRVIEQGAIKGQPNLRLATYGLPREYQPPRMVRFGIRYAY